MSLPLSFGMQLEFNVNKTEIFGNYNNENLVQKSVFGAILNQSNQVRKWIKKVRALKDN